MRSGVRIPFHFEVAEAQRIAAEQERIKLEGTSSDEQRLLQGQQQDEAKTTGSDIAGAGTISQSELLRQITNKTKNAMMTTMSNGNSDLLLTPEQKANALRASFVQTPADPPSLSDFDNLNKMAEVPRYDAFYKAPLVPLNPFRFSPRWRYVSLFRKYAIHMEQFLSVDDDQAISVAHAFKHHESGVTVTLLPVVHIAHPSFWVQVDELCCQHHSVLMEGRYSPTSSDISVVPPRDKYVENRPEEEMDAEGWEPPADANFTKFRQPYSWGVKDSPVHTIIHAADSYDYDRLPMWARIRHNVPFLGGYKREKRALNILHQLSGNGYESFILPWGVAHMPIFSKMLIQNGFVLSGTSRVVMFNRIDGPTSAAFVRKLKSTVSWAAWFSVATRFCVAMGAVHLGGYALGLSMRDIVEYEDLADLGIDSPRRRAWDSAMAPSIGQTKLRHGGDMAVRKY